MPHNHSPRCCCTQPDHSIRATAETCPSCVEHGELAALGNNAPIADNPDDDTDTWLAAQPAVLAAQRARLGALTVDRAQTGPSTPDLRSQIASQPAECPSCHTTDGHPHTDYCHVPIDPASVPYGTEIGTYRAMGDPVRWVRHWATQTSQPAATTSQPPTHTRPRPKILIDFATCPCQQPGWGVTAHSHHPLCQHHPHNRASTPDQ